MAVRIVAAREPDAPIDRHSGQLQKALRSAQAVVRLIPNAGFELRIDRAALEPGIRVEQTAQETSVSSGDSASLEAV